jgi:hypothetical protein
LDPEPIGRLTLLEAPFSTTRSSCLVQNDPMASGEVTAAVITSSVAAIASVLTLVLTRWGTRTSEFRASHRTLLYPKIERLGNLIHQVTALSTMHLVRAEQGRELALWRQKADRAGAELTELRREIRYPLWGLDDALRTLARVPSWVANYGQRIPEGCSYWIEQANSVRQSTKP